MRESYIFIISPLYFPSLKQFHLTNYIGNKNNKEKYKCQQRGEQSEPSKSERSEHRSVLHPLLKNNTKNPIYKINKDNKFYFYLKFSL